MVKGKKQKFPLIEKGYLSLVIRNEKYKEKIENSKSLTEIENIIKNYIEEKKLNEKEAK